MAADPGASSAVGPPGRPAPHGPSDPSDPSGCASRSAGTVIVFGRVPVLGQVKTRLAAHVGDERALELHRRMLAHSLGVARDSGRRVELCIAGADVDGECAALAVRHGAHLTAQVGRDLGMRMRGALERALSGNVPAVLVGCDCPALEVDDVLAAFSALASHDAVFSPTEDGGYVLVGMRRPLTGIFDGPQWGSPQVMAQTRARLVASGAHWHELRTLWDVDRVQDLERWLGRSD